MSVNLNDFGMVRPIFYCDFLSFEQYTLKMFKTLEFYILEKKKLLSTIPPFMFYFLYVIYWELYFFDYYFNNLLLEDCCNHLVIYNTRDCSVSLFFELLFSFILLVKKGLVWFKNDN